MIKEFLKNHGEYYDDKYFSSLTTLKMGGQIKHLVYPNSIQDLKEIISYLKDNKCSFKILGNGSNLVCGKDEYDGVVVCLKKLNGYEISNDEIKVDAGVLIPSLAAHLAKEGYSALEFASGIPGTLGGLVYMNAGAYKMSMADIVKKVLVLKDDELVWFDNSEMEFSYRKSIMQSHPRWVVVQAVLKLERKDSNEIEKVMLDRLERRRMTQPLDKPSAGSCFRNPDNTFAWKLIDEIGYRGKTRNGVTISSKHSNFLVNEDHGTADDYLSLVYEIQDIILEKYGIKLVMEVEKFNC